jgi:hypothetical protein
MATATTSSRIDPRGEQERNQEAGDQRDDDVETARPIIAGCGSLHRDRALCLLT